MASSADVGQLPSTNHGSLSVNDGVTWRHLCRKNGVKKIEWNASHEGFLCKGQRKTQITRLGFWIQWSDGVSYETFVQTALMRCGCATFSHHMQSEANTVTFLFNCKSKNCYLEGVVGRVFAHPFERLCFTKAHLWFFWPNVMNVEQVSVCSVCVLCTWWEAQKLLSCFQ